MRLVTVAIAVATLAGGAVPAFAAPAQIGDAQFIAANRCLGILSSKNLGAPDAAAALKVFIKDQSWSRPSEIYDAADDARDEGYRDASRGGAANDIGLTRERDGVCRRFLSQTTASVGGAPATP
jgi:hypothetical protein